MTLVFKAVGPATEHIAVLLAVDWFLDRCRTTINVLGDINVSCLLDGARRGILLWQDPRYHKEGYQSDERLISQRAPRCWSLEDGRGTCGIERLAIKFGSGTA